MKTNIRQLGYIYFSIDPDQRQYLNQQVDNKYANRKVGSSVLFLIKFVYFLIKSPFRFPQKIKRGCVLFFGESKNNLRALEPIVEKIGKTNCETLFSSYDYPSWRQYLYALPHISEFWKTYKKMSPYDKGVVDFFFSKFLRMYGCNRMASDILDAYSPTVLVLANDHLPLNRALMFVANERHIPTLYVQHASITEKFPPLEFTYSLLDGEDALEKYMAAGPLQSNVFLCGGVRFDRIRKMANLVEDINYIGVAINEVDDPETVKKTCRIIQNFYKQKGKQVVLRPHPSMPQDTWVKWCKENDIVFSNAREESSFAFLSRLDVLISNQSSIHLDAAMCHKPALVFNLSSEPLDDYYGFVKKRLVPYATNIDDVLRFIESSNEFTYNDEIVRYYNSSYNTSFEGNVSGLICDVIRELHKKGSVIEIANKYGFRNEKLDENLIFKI